LRADIVLAAHDTAIVAFVVICAAPSRTWVDDAREESDQNDLMH
jgi:hypothetical protein